MNISDIDSNFKVDCDLKRDDISWLDITRKPFSIHGLFNPCDGKPFRRMPQAIADATSGGVAYLNTNTAGGRIRFATNSPYIAIYAKLPRVDCNPHMTLLGSSGFDAYVNRNRKSEFLGSFIPPTDMTDGYCSVIDTGSNGELYTYTINFPNYNPVDSVLIGLKNDSLIEEAAPYYFNVPVLYYGSSITQGGCASRPGNAYQSIISRELDCDFINLGFSGSACGEDAVAEYMAKLDMSVFVCDYDHNAPSCEHLVKTHRHLYDTIRLWNMNTPYVIISKPDFDSNKVENAKRREIIYKTYEYALDYGDKNVYYIDGETLFGSELRDACTVDGCHPNDLGFARMAQTIGLTVAAALNSSVNAK